MDEHVLIGGPPESLKNIPGSTLLRCAKCGRDVSVSPAGQRHLEALVGKIRLLCAEHGLEAAAAHGAPLQPAPGVLEEVRDWVLRQRRN